MHRRAVSEGRITTDPISDLEITFSNLQLHKKIHATIQLNTANGTLYRLVAVSIRKQFDTNIQKVSPIVGIKFSGVLCYTDLLDLSDVQTAFVSIQNDHVVAVRKASDIASTPSAETPGTWIEMNPSLLFSSDSMSSHLPILPSWSEKAPASVNINLWDEKLYDLSVPSIQKVFIGPPGEVESENAVVSFLDNRLQIDVYKKNALTSISVYTSILEGGEHDSQVTTIYPTTDIPATGKLVEIGTVIKQNSC
ncbi:hypothetical protein Clacol_004931 [Clathrus columnatus]|uniref:Uncharacterized protein n=1 Tax=Clathrus columnatus TaxID=1419009 RepID=A0AAV5ADC5_9AGAM|nr:hypothetical protein Clacol_004931 [Clathrus columnatus]